MKIKRFACTNLHAFISHQFDLFSDVSFLHGINGSGKTSILRAIASLLTPDPIWLFSTAYDQISIEIEHNAQEFTLSASKGHTNSVTLQITGGIELADTISLDDVRPIAMPSQDAFFWEHDPDEISTRIRLATESATTFHFVASLPTPIFLGLDRTTLTPTMGTQPAPRSARARGVQPYFRTALDEAIHEAARLLTQQLSALSGERNKIFEELRNEFVLTLFQLPEVEPAGGRPVPLDQDTLKYLQRMRASVIAALKKINISNDAINTTVEPFFKQVSAVATTALSAQKEFSSVAEENKKKAKPSITGQLYSDLMQKIGPYFNVLPSINTIERTLKRIEEADTKDKIISRPIETYQSIMNSFFEDSGKALAFEGNVVRVRLPSEKLIALTALSSGERQIFVLITHLIFNPRIRGENILLIDEPELSLHLKWQRQFVHAIREASPATQMVLATHSPEIIFDMEANLIPLRN